MNSKAVEPEAKRTSTRRQVVAWMGLGVVGAFVVNLLPFRFLSKKFTNHKPAGNKVAIKLNNQAVMRVKSGSASRGKGLGNV